MKPGMGVSAVGRKTRFEFAIASGGSDRNLYTLAVAAGYAGEPEVFVTVGSGAVFNGSTTSQYAINFGTGWPSSLTKLRFTMLNGYARGKGGAGGTAVLGAAGGNGGAGGPAINIPFALSGKVEIDLGSSGHFHAGGGGAGAGGGADAQYENSQKQIRTEQVAGGGGGAGAGPSSAGTGSSGTTGSQTSAQGGNGGNGGDYGAAGANGSSGVTGDNVYSAGTGGAAGKAVELNGGSAPTWIDGNNSTQIKGAVS